MSVGLSILNLGSSGCIIFCPLFISRLSLFMTLSPWHFLVGAAIALLDLRRPTASELAVSEVSALPEEVGKLRQLVEHLERGCSECWWRTWALTWLNRGLSLGLVFLIVLICFGFWGSRSTRVRIEPTRLREQSADTGSDSDRASSVAVTGSAASSRRSGPFRPSDRLKLKNG